MPQDDAQNLSEIEIMARSGFLSIVGMTSVQISQKDHKGKAQWI